jgi:hypothetical protein
LLWLSLLVIIIRTIRKIKNKTKKRKEVMIIRVRRPLVLENLLLRDIKRKTNKNKTKGFDMYLF